jgi:hypothetical protein
MFLDRKPLLYLWRPAHRVIFGGIVWPFMGRMKQFFTAESSADLAEIVAMTAVLRTTQQILERDLDLMARQLTRMQARLEDQSQQMGAIRAVLEGQSERMMSALTARETEQRDQWRATESLLLSLFSNSTGHLNRLANGGVERSRSGAVAR